MTVHDMDRLLTPEEVCEYLQIKQSMLYRMTSEGRIPFLKLGGLLRFRRSEIEAWLQRHGDGERRRRAGARS